MRTRQTTSSQKGPLKRAGLCGFRTCRLRKVFLKITAATVAATFFWTQNLWALDPRQKLLDDAQKLLELQSGARSGSAIEASSFTAQNTSDVTAQSDLQSLIDQNAQTLADPAASPEPQLTLKTSTGDLLQMQDGQIARITRADGTMLAGLTFDADGRITDADLLLGDGTIQVVRDGAAIAAQLPDGTRVFYNAAGRVEKAILPDASEVGYAYQLDAAGAVLKTTVTSADNVSEYDASGKILQTVFASGKKIFYSDGRIARIENGGVTYRYASAVQSGLIRLTLSYCEDASGNRYDVDASGAVTTVTLLDGTQIRNIRWQTGAIADARVIRSSGDIYEYQNSMLARYTSAAGVVTSYGYAGDRVTASSQGRSTEYLRSTRDVAKTTLVDGTVIVYNLQGIYKGYPSQTTAPDGAVSTFDYAVNASGMTTILRKEAVVSPPLSAATPQLNNPIHRSIFKFNSTNTANKVTITAALAAAGTTQDTFTFSWLSGRWTLVKASKNLLTGRVTSSTTTFSQALAAGKDYAAEVRIESGKINLYVYEAALAKPATATMTSAVLISSAAFTSAYVNAAGRTESYKNAAVLSLAELGAYVRGCPFRTVAADGTVTFYDYAYDAAGKLTAVKREAVSSPFRTTTTYASAAAIAYTANPTLSFTASLNPQSSDTRLRVQADNTAAANIVLELVPGTGSTYKFGAGAAIPLGVTLDASKTYTGELRWEATGVGIYVYVAGTTRPATPLARVASKTWNPKFSLIATDAGVASYVPSSGTFLRTIKTDDKSAVQQPGNPIQRTFFRFDNANAANQVVLTAVQPASGTTQNTFTFTWLSGKWTLVKASKNTTTGVVTNTTTTFAQALTAGKEYAAELRLESGKINLYVYETMLTQPTTATMSSTVLVATTAFTTSYTNASGRTETFRNVGAADLNVFVNPTVVNDTAVRPLLTGFAAPVVAIAANAPDLLSVDYETSTSKIARTVQRDGTVTEFTDGLLKSVLSQGTVTNFLMTQSAYGNLSALTMEHSGLKTSYDAKGNLKSVTTRGTDGVDQTVFYDSVQKIVRIEKSDGTRIEDVVFDGAVIRDAVVRLPDGAVRRYAAGRIIEERKADGTLTAFADGRPIESRMADGRIYVYEAVPAALSAPSAGAYTMILKEYRTDGEDRVELDIVTGLPVRITRANGDVITQLGLNTAGDLTDYSVQTRDGQGAAWTLIFTGGELVEAQNASGEKAYFQNNRLVRVTAPGQPDTSLTYDLDAAGAVTATRVTRGGELRVFDGAGRLMRFEADGIVAEYDAQGIKSIANATMAYLRPVFAADGTLTSGQIRTDDGTLHTIADSRLVRTLRPDGIEVGFDASGLVARILENSKETTFGYTRDAAGAVQDVKAYMYGVVPVGLPDFIKSGTNPGYWPVKGQGGWHVLTQYNPSASVKLVGGGSAYVYDKRPSTDTASKYYLPSSAVSGSADRIGTSVNFDNYQSVPVKQGGFVFVKFRVENAPALTSVRVRPAFGASTDFDDFAREVSVSSGVMTVLMPITHATTLPVSSINFDFIPPQKTSDVWTLAVEQAGYFELDTAQSRAHESELFLGGDDRALVIAQPASSRIPTASDWTAKAFVYNRLKSTGDAAVRMTLGSNGEAIDSALADGAETLYAAGRASSVTSPDGTVTEYVYDADGKVAEMSTRPAGGAKTTTRYAYGKIREVASEDGTVIYRYAYEFEGDKEFMVITDTRSGEVKRYSSSRLLTSVDAEGLLTTYAYTDAASGTADPAANTSAADPGRDRIASSVVTWKGQVLRRFTYSYDGDETRITDEAGLTKIYGLSGKLTFLETADGLRYKKSDLKDESGNAVEEDALFSAKTADGVTLFYKNDTVEKIVLKDGTVINVAEDQNVYRNVLLKEGLVDEVTRDDGSTAKYLRDEIGRLTFVEVTRGEKVYRYDAQGDLVRVTEPALRRTTDFGFRRDDQGRVTATRVIQQTRSLIGSLDLPVVLRAASYGMLDGWNSSITVNGTDYSDFNLNINASDGAVRSRGWSVAQVDASGKVIAKVYFDPYALGTGEADRMATFLEAIPNGDAVIMAVADEGSKNLTDRALNAIESFGSVKIRGLGYRDSFALVGQKGAAAGSAIEELKKLGEDAAFASNATTEIFYYDAAGKAITYDAFAQSPSVSWNAYHSFENEPELEAFAATAAGTAGWRKNFNPAHPDSGFVYLWDGVNAANYANNEQNLADYVALTSQVSASGRYVYYDPKYPSSLSGSFPLTMKNYLTARGYQVVDAAGLKNFFQTHGPDSALIMLQSVMPETVYDPLSPYSIAQRNIPKEYMENGGTIVWTHDLPFYYVGRSDGTKTTIGEKGLRQMLGVIPTTRSTTMKRQDHAQSFDWGTEGYRFTGTGTTFQTGSVRFQITPTDPIARVEAISSETLGTGYFGNLKRQADVRVEAGSSLSVGFNAVTMNGSAAGLSVRFEEDQTIRAYVQDPSGSITGSWSALTYEPGTDYSVEFFDKGDWTEVYVYRSGEARPINMTGKITHGRWTDGTFFAQGNKGTSSLLGTSAYIVTVSPTSAASTATVPGVISSDQPVLDASVLTYDSNVNFRQVSWSAVKNQLGNVLKSDTPIVSTYDAQGKLLSLARADRTVLVYEPGTDRLDAVYDLAGNTLTDYVYDAQNNLIEIKNAGQRRALDEALFDAKRQVSLQKSEALLDQALEANLITQSFLDQVNAQRAQLDAQRNNYQTLLNDLEGQNVKGSSAKKQKSLTLDAYRDAIRQIDQARNDLEEEVSRQLSLLGSALNDKKLSIESDFSRAFTQLESEFAKTYLNLQSEEQKALTAQVYREVLGRDPKESEFLQAQGLSPQSLRTTLAASPEQLTRKARKDKITQNISNQLDEFLNTQTRSGLLVSLGLLDSEVMSLPSEEIQKIKAFLSSQGLHFAESAIDPLMELLKSQGQSFTEEERSLLAARLILIDILTGQIHPFLKTGEEMVVSLYAMQKTLSIYTAPAQSLRLSYDDLKNLTLKNPSDRAVLHVEGKHYVNLIQATNTEVTILDNGEVKHLSKEDFQKVWQGTTLLPDAHAPPVAVEKRISAAEAKEIKGAFFWFIPMIIGAISSITAAVGAVITAIGTILATIGTIITNVVITLSQVLTGVIQGIGTLSKAIFTGLKFAGTHLFGGGLTGLFAPATQGGFFGLSLNSITATSLFKSAISIGLNYGLQRGLDALGVNPGISSVLTGFVTGGFLGGITPTGFNSSLLLQEGLKGAVQAGSRTLFAASGLDSTVGDILSILTSAPSSSGGWQGNIGGQLITINPTIVQSLISYGIQKLGNSIGLDPRISGLIGLPISNAIGAGLQVGQDFTKTLIKGVQDGILSGAVGYGVTKLSSAISPASPLVAGLLSRTFTGLIDGFLNPNMSMLQGASQALTDSFGNFAKSTVTGDFASLVSQKGLAKALEDYAVGIFTRDALEEIVKAGGIAQVLSGSARYAQIAFGSSVMQVKEVTVGSTQLYYSAYDDKNLFGRKIGNRFERGYFGYDAQGKVVLRSGEIEVDFGNEQTTVIKINNYAPIGYEIRFNGQPVAVSYHSNGEYRLGSGLETENGVFESKVTGAKIVFKDGFADEIYIPGPTGQSLRIQGSMRDLSPDELSRIVAYLAITSNGINNSMSEGQQPLKMQALNDAIQASGGDASRIIMPIPLYENSHGGAGLVQDVLTWLGDIVAGTDLITNEMLTKIQQSFAANTALTALGATMVLYSGAGNPGLKASQKGGLNVSSVVLIGTPLLQSVVGNPHTNTIVQIFGENDPLGRLVSPDHFYKTEVGGEEVDNFIRIQIKGIGHTEYMTDNATDPKMVRVMGEIAKIIDLSKNPIALKDYLSKADNKWFTRDSISGKYILDPDKLPDTN